LPAASYGALVRRVADGLNRHVGYPLLRFTLPTRCFGCLQPLERVQRLGACHRCWAGLRPLCPPLCPGCGLPRPAGTDLLGPAGGRCAACVLRPLALDGVRAAVAYDELARRFLLRAKFGGRPELLVPLAEQLATVLSRSGFARGCSCVIAVPAHPLARLRRGFDPARELAREVARRLGLPRRRGMRRRLHPGPAKRLRAAERVARLRGAFGFRGRLQDARVLLVDDVLTTGATALACAAALRTAGAVEVRAAAWARTPPPEV
jgi:predicted amidophosphoribosyltransferase